MFEEHSSSFSSPYLFNGKELDRETNLSYFGARYYDAKTSLWLSVDPLKEKMPSHGAYVYAFNNPLGFVDPDGRFPILVNGKVSGDKERANSSYWNSKIRSTISKQTGYSESSFKYVDGDQGFWAGSRIKAGAAKGKSDAANIYARMKKNMKGGKITEQLQFITHSRGGAFGKGYMDGVSAEIANLAKKEGIEFAYGANNIIEYSVNLAPHQSNSIDYKYNGSKNVNISHVGDSLSGDDATGNVVNAESDAETNDFDQHGNGTYNTELNFILKILKNNTKKSNLMKEVKEGYRNYDNNRTNGGRAIITEGSN
ncbi:tRNA nuclease WapA precursor [compost metagenome]